jgi:hypothetical protein
MNETLRRLNWLTNNPNIEQYLLFFDQAVDRVEVLKILTDSKGSLSYKDEDIN